MELPPLDVQRHVVVALGDLHHRSIVLVEAGVVQGVPAELSTATTNNEENGGVFSLALGCFLGEAVRFNAVKGNSKRHNIASLQKLHKLATCVCTVFTWKKKKKTEESTGAAGKPQNPKIK